MIFVFKSIFLSFEYFNTINRRKDGFSHQCTNMLDNIVCYHFDLLPLTHVCYLTNKIIFYRPGGAGGGSRELVAYTKTAESPAQSQTPTRVCI